MPNTLSLKVEAAALCAELQLILLEAYTPAALVELPVAALPFWRVDACPTAAAAKHPPPPPARNAAAPKSAPPPPPTPPLSAGPPPAGPAPANTAPPPAAKSLPTLPLKGAAPLPAADAPLNAAAKGAPTGKGPFALNIPPPPSPDQYEDISAAMQKLFPNIPQLSTPQPPAPAPAGHHTVLLLDLGENAETRQMMEKIAEAITTRLQTPATVLTLLPDQASLPLEGPVRLLMAPLHRLAAHPLFAAGAAAAHATTIIQHQGRPLWMMPDLTLLLSQPDLKRKLWETICQLVGRHAKT